MPCPSVGREATYNCTLCWHYAASKAASKEQHGSRQDGQWERGPRDMATQAKHAEDEGATGVFSVAPALASASSGVSPHVIFSLPFLFCPLSFLSLLRLALLFFLSVPSFRSFPLASFCILVGKPRGFLGSCACSLPFAARCALAAKQDAWRGKRRKRLKHHQLTQGRRTPKAEGRQAGCTRQTIKQLHRQAATKKDSLASSRISLQRPPKGRVPQGHHVPRKPPRTQGEAKTPKAPPRIDTLGLTAFGATGRLTRSSGTQEKHSKKSLPPGQLDVPTGEKKDTLKGHSSAAKT